MFKRKEKVTAHRAPSFEEARERLHSKITKLFRTHMAQNLKSYPDPEVNHLMMCALQSVLDDIKKTSSIEQLITVKNTMVFFCVEQLKRNPVGYRSFLKDIKNELVSASNSLAECNRKTIEDRELLTELFACCNSDPEESTRKDIPRMQNNAYFNDKKVSSLLNPDDVDTSGCLIKGRMERLCSDAGISKEVQVFFNKNLNQHGLYQCMAYVPAKLCDNSNDNLLYVIKQNDVAYYNTDLSTLTWKQLHTLITALGYEKAASACGLGYEEFNDYILQATKIDASILHLYSETDFKNILQISGLKDFERAFPNKNNTHCMAIFPGTMICGETQSPFDFTMDIDIQTNEIQKVNITVSQEHLAQLKETIVDLDKEIKKAILSSLEMIIKEPAKLMEELLEKQKRHDLNLSCHM